MSGTVPGFRQHVLEKLASASTAGPASRSTNNLCYSNRYEGIYASRRANTKWCSIACLATAAPAFISRAADASSATWFIRMAIMASRSKACEGDYREVVNNLCYLNGNAPGEYQHHRRRQLLAGQARPHREQHLLWRQRHLHRQPHCLHQPQQHHLGHRLEFRRARSLHGHGQLPQWAIFESDNNLIYATDGAIVGQWNGNQTRTGRLAIRHQAGLPQLRRQSAIRESRRARTASSAAPTAGTTTSISPARRAASRARRSRPRPAPRSRPTPPPARPLTRPRLRVRIGDEIAPNGSRRNLGAFGGTFDASLSPGTPGISILNLAANDNLRGVKTLYWITRGPWAGGETLRLEWSTNGGANWSPVPGANARALQPDSRYDWDTSSLHAGCELHRAPRGERLRRQPAGQSHPHPRQRPDRLLRQRRQPDQRRVLHGHRQRQQLRPRAVRAQGHAQAPLPRLQADGGRPRLD